MPRRREILLVAWREVRLLGRSRAAAGALALLVVVAWLPGILLALRSGALGLAPFTQTVPLQVALAGVVLPLLALLAGAELLAGELEDGSLIPLVTLPISRRACFAGKLVGRSSLLAAAYLVIFTAAGATTAIVRGSEGLRDWASVAGAGLLLSIAAAGVGVALGTAGRGRVRAFGTALVAWVVLVFGLDAALLTVVVASAPPPPPQVGEHGHGELQPPARAAASEDDPHARHAEPLKKRPARLSSALMALSPVSLFRLTAFAGSPALRPRLELVLPGSSTTGVVATLAMGWSLWLVLPLVHGLRRFLRLDLN